jgi:hypothetical protein
MIGTLEPIPEIKSSIISSKKTNEKYNIISNKSVPFLKDNYSLPKGYSILHDPTKLRVIQRFNDDLRSNARELNSSIQNSSEYKSLESRNSFEPK